MFFGLKNGIVMDVIGTFGSSGMKFGPIIRMLILWFLTLQIFFVLLVYYLSEFTKGCNVCVLHE